MWSAEAACDQSFTAGDDGIEPVTAPEKTAFGVMCTLLSKGPAWLATIAGARYELSSKGALGNALLSYITGVHAPDATLFDPHVPCCCAYAGCACSSFMKGLLVPLLCSNVAAGTGVESSAGPAGIPISWSKSQSFEGENIALESKVDPRRRSLGDMSRAESRRLLSRMLSSRIEESSSSKNDLRESIDNVGCR